MCHTNFWAVKDSGDRFAISGSWCQGRRWDLDIGPLLSRLGRGSVARSRYGGGERHGNTSLNIKHYELRGTVVAMHMQERRQLQRLEARSKKWPGQTSRTSSLRRIPLRPSLPGLDPSKLDGFNVNTISRNKEPRDVNCDVVEQQETRFLAPFRS
jgi:hypothetical protein